MSLFRQRASSSTDGSSRWSTLASSPHFSKSPSIRKPCRFGSSCVKFGCPFQHPPSRPRDCPNGEYCVEVKCSLHHPKSRQQQQPSFRVRRLSFSCLHDDTVPRQPPNTQYSDRQIVRSPMVIPTTTNTFVVGQMVQAKFSPTSTKWSDAIVRYSCGSSLKLQFIGYDDIVEIPLERVRDVSNDMPNDPQPPVIKHFVTPPRPRLASPIVPPSSPPPSPSSLSDLRQLERLKQNAVVREDFIVADQIKQRILRLKKIVELQKQKQEAVSKEDFMLAMQLKNQIVELST